MAVLRIFALSDIHVDYSENERWIFNISSTDYQDDILLLAGDISENLFTMERCFVQLSKKFLHVIFVPGNHDLWVNCCDVNDSLLKYQYVDRLAQQTGLITKAFTIGDLYIVPILGWYDYSFGNPGVQLLHSWMDFKCCSWPNDWHVRDITQFFLGRNCLTRIPLNKVVLTLSHFLPRIDIMPDHIPQSFRYLYPVLGSSRIDEQIQSLKPVIHVYGHSHINRQVMINDILYVNNSFGYPSETRISRKALLCIYEM